MIFEKQNLSNLKSLHFDIKQAKIELVDNEEEINTTGVVGKGE
jgi:energy-converting hydrogenase A subunit M